LSRNLAEAARPDLAAPCLREWAAQFVASWLRAVAREKLLGGPTGRNWAALG